jgi:hypothetical protein
MDRLSIRRTILAVGWIAIMPTLAPAQPPSTPRPPAPLVTSPAGSPFTPDEKTSIAAAVLGHPRVAAMVAGHKVRVLSTVREEPDKGVARAAAPSGAVVILFDYTAGYAIRARVNTSTAALVSEERLTGRPPASPEELAEASRIVRANPDDARLLDAGNVLEGGFVVDPPKRVRIESTGVPHRIIQLQILSPDRARLERLIHVDLTTEKVIASETP